MNEGGLAIASLGRRIGTSMAQVPPVEAFTEDRRRQQRVR